LLRVLSVEARVKVATQLAEAGVRRMELTVDYPPRTTYEQTLPVVRALKDRGVDVIMHGRATEEDLAAISRYDIAGCGLYIAVSKLHRDFKLHGISEQESIERLRDSVEKARSLGFRYIRATMEDASRPLSTRVRRASRGYCPLPSHSENPARLCSAYPTLQAS